MVFCVYCGRSFNRNEHLQRHVLTHTKVRPFKCAICHLSFTRRDLVRKHYKSHTRPEVEACEKAISESLQPGKAFNVPPLNGQRVSVACATCAKTKTKCDQQDPCGRCRSRGLTCIPRATKRHSQEIDSFDAASFTDTENSPVQSAHGGMVEVAASIMDKPLQSQESPAITDEGDGSVHVFDARLTPHPGNISLQSPTAYSSALPRSTDHAELRVPPLTAIPSNFTAPVPMSPSDSQQALERSFGASLPQLDWQSLNSNYHSRQHSNILSVPTQTMAEMNAYENSDWHPFDIPQENSRIRDAQPVMNNEMLFSFNAEMNAWETRLSALDSIMGGHSHPVGSKAQTDVERPQSGITPESSSDLHNWSPQDKQMSLDVFIPEDELEGWALGQCTNVSDATSSQSSPENDPMRQGYEDSTTWSYAVERFRDSCFEPHERIENVDLTDETREWMLIAVQQFLRAGMESQEAQKLSGLAEAPPGSTTHPSERFLLLPPKTSLQKYLDIFLTTFEPFTPMIPALSLNPNKLASRSREREATLLLFLMIAFGSMIDPAPRARHFSYELTEICRHSLRKATDNAGISKRDTLSLHCALIFTCLTSFSGRKSHMDIGTAQRHMYLAMMRNAGYFRHPRAQNLYSSCGEDQLEKCWKAWTDDEIMSRLCYSWVIADQEISLFYDTPAFLVLSELEIELPGDEKLWMSPDAQTWRTAFNETQHDPNQDSDFSLRELFSLFAEGRLQDFGRDFNVMDLRLLLHPLHSLVSNYCQVTSSLNSRSRRSRDTSNRIRSSSSQTFEEIHALTRRWMAAFQTLDVKGARLIAAARATLIQYHLISINLLCSFKKLERFSRKRDPELVEEFASSIQEELNKHSSELLVHCGQILRLVREADVKLRPPWWSIAVYRAILVIWVYSFTRRYMLRQAGTTQRPAGPAVELDVLPFFDPKISHYLLHRVGDPQLTAGVGSIMPVDHPRGVLQTGIDALGRGPRLWRLTRGLQCKLEALYRNWETLHQKLES